MSAPAMKVRPAQSNRMAPTSSSPNACSSPACNPCRRGAESAFTGGLSSVIRATPSTTTLVAVCFMSCVLSGGRLRAPAGDLLHGDGGHRLLVELAGGGDGHRLDQHQVFRPSLTGQTLSPEMVARRGPVDALIRSV